MKPDAVRRRALIGVTVAFALLTVFAAGAAAEFQQLSSYGFAHLFSGDCRIRASLPLDANVAMARLLRNDNEAVAAARVVKPRNPQELLVEFRVATPPLPNERFAVTLPDHEPLVEVVRHLGPDRATCEAKDDRGVFVPAILMGVSADAFAPNEKENYPAATDYSLKRSSIVRVDAQLRVGGNRGTWADRVWLPVSMKYGVRSTDLDCQDKDKQSPVCRNNAFEPPSKPGEVITAAVLRATKIEAVFRPRFELATMNGDSDMPWVIYVLGRFGFGQAPDEVKVENTFAGGLGFMFAAGPFYGSGVETTFGVDRGYRTNPGGGRVRTQYRLLFGAPPKFTDQLPFLSKAGRSLRGLIEVIVDRNSLGPGPDATQTMLGVTIDVRQLVR